MKIYRAQDLKTEPRERFSLGILGEVSLPKNVSTIGFFRPAVPANGRLRNHLHEEVIEFMFFLEPAQIKSGVETFDISPGDMVMISPGEPHEVLAGRSGNTPLVIKVPNNPKDVKVPPLEKHG